MWQSWDRNEMHIISNRKPGGIREGNIKLDLTETE
jgi:hypothetical protein